MTTERKYRNLIARKTILESELKRKKKKLSNIERDINSYKEIKVYLNQIGLKIRKNFKNKVEPLITMAIKAVFDRPLKFKMVFNENSNKIDLMVKEGEHYYHPKNEMGGGLLNIIGFALRIVNWKMNGKKSRNLFILDEPFHFTGALVDRAGDMLRYLSNKLKFQVLLLTHEEVLKSICNRAYKTTHNDIETKVEQIRRKIKRRK